MSKQEQFRYLQVSEFMSGKVSRSVTARLLQLTERTITRIAANIYINGLKGVTHGNRGKPVHNKTSDKLKVRVMKLVKNQYYDFNMLHCLEILKKNHKLVVSRETFRGWCHEIQLVKRKKRRRAQSRFLRSRIPAEGYLLQMDASPHRYNGKDVWHLVHAIDDVTSEIPYGEFFYGETTLACMKVIKAIIKLKGIPRAIYTDRAGWSGGQKRTEFSQFKRACEELSIQVLFADSPEAKGRVERSFDTFQDRIIPELRIEKIKTIEAANGYLQKKFLPEYWNKRNTVIPRLIQSEYRSLSKLIDLDEIFCIKDYRIVSRAHSFSLDGNTYVIKAPLKHSLQSKKIELRFHENKPMAIYFEDKKLTYKLVHRYQKPEKTWDEHVEYLEQTLGRRPRKNHDSNRIKQLIKEQSILKKKKLNETNWLGT